MASRELELILKAKDTASRVLKKFGVNLDEIGGKHMAMATAAIGASVVVVKALDKIVNAAKALLDETSALGDQFDKMSARTTVAADELSRWDFVMARAGGNSATIEASIRRLTRSMFDYTRGLSSSVEAWDRLGVSPLDAAGNLKSVTDILLEMSDAMAAMDNETERMGLSQEMLGRGAAQMVAMLSQGSYEIGRQMRLLDQINGVMEVEFTQAAARVVDAQEDVRRSVKGFRADLAEPFLDAYAQSLSDLSLVIGDLGRKAETVSPKIADLAEKMSWAFIPLAAARLLLGLYVDRLRDQADAAEATAVAQEFLNKVWEDSDGPVQIPMRHLEDMPSAADEAMRRLRELADVWDIETSEMKLDPNTGLFALVPKDAEKLAGEIQEAFDEAAAILAKGPPTTVPVAPKVVDAPDSDDPDEDVSNLLMQVEGVEDLERGWDDARKSQERYTKQMRILEDVAASAMWQLESGLATSIQMFMTGQAGGIAFADVIRSTLITAVSQLIAKMIVAATLGALLGLISGGTSVAAAGAWSMNAGGTVPGKARRAAFGYTVPEGRRGMDSVPILAEPGEEVIRRSLSQRMDRFLAMVESSSIVTPQPYATGGQGATIMQFHVGRPVGPIDASDMGNAMIRAQRRAARREVA